MVRALGLDPGQYRGTYKLIGGTPALDFANLVSYRGTEREHDWLEPATNAEQWVRAVGIGAPAREDIATVRRFREVLARVFLSIADGADPSPAHVEEIGDRAVQAWVRRRLVHHPGTSVAAWADPAPTLVTVLALDAVSLLTSPDTWQRISACDECRWVFLDGSRNNSRRWCDPADCGNRSRQRRHYSRHRSS